MSMVAWFLSLSPAGVGFLLEELEMDKITSDPPKILRPLVRMSQQLQCVSTLHLLLASQNCSKCANYWCIESLINTRTLKKRCALAARTEVKQTQEL